MPAVKAGAALVKQRIMVAMAFTLFIALAAFPGSVGAGDAAPRATIEVVARAQILSSVRMSQAETGDGQSEQMPRLRLREQACPEPGEQPCTLLILDMP